jgi:hypothetical protein
VTRRSIVALCVLAACRAAPVSDPVPAAVAVAVADLDAGIEAVAVLADDAAVVTPAVATLSTDGPDIDAGTGTGAGSDAGVVAVRPPPPRWLKGSTHVHAAPSGDSRTDVPSVIAWYESHGYDFIVLTDHNRVTRIDGAPRAGGASVRFPDKGLVVLAGIELTYNPGACDPPPPEPDGKCRIHVNGLGVLTSPTGKIEWADRKATTRVGMYRAALRWISAAGGLVQLNHPQWHWGTSTELLSHLAGEGVRLVEIANVQFARWNAGDGKRPSMEQLWDAVLTAGGTMWGVASDDAHDYQPDGGGKYPAGGAWIMVDAARDPAAIIAAIDRGEFYSSTGVALVRADVWDNALEVIVDTTPAAAATHTIRFIGPGGKVLAETRGAQARYPFTSTLGYVRAVVERSDGARAWVQPVRPGAHAGGH